LVDPGCLRVDVVLLEQALGVNQIELIEDAIVERRGPGGVVCPFDVGEDPSALTIELWPSIPDEQMEGLLRSPPYASEGSIEVTEQDGLWLVETGDNELAVFTTRGDRWWSLGLRLPPEDEFPDLSSLEQALDLAAEQIG
jgi:hypothetical protein